jgi:hypothetical protein
MAEQMTHEQALRIVRDCYITGRPQSEAAQSSGLPATKIAAEYRRLKRSNIPAVAGQLELFETG